MTWSHWVQRGGMHSGVPVVNGKPAGSGADMREEMTGNFLMLDSMLIHNSFICYALVVPLS
jgi:hypothetical protein